MTSGTGIPGRSGTGKLKPSGAGGCRFSAVLPSGIHGGERRGRGQWPVVIWSRGVCHTPEPELSTSLPPGEIRGD